MRRALVRRTEPVRLALMQIARLVRELTASAVTDGVFPGEEACEWGLVAQYFANGFPMR